MCVKGRRKRRRVIRETVEKMRKQREIKIVICVIPRCVNDSIRDAWRNKVQLNFIFGLKFFAKEGSFST